MVAVGQVRARVVCLRVCNLVMIVGALVCLAFPPLFDCSRIVCIVEECVGCVRGVRWVGAMVWRECGVYSIFGTGRVVRRDGCWGCV